MYLEIARYVFLPSTGFKVPNFKCDMSIPLQFLWTRS